MSSRLQPTNRFRANLFSSTSWSAMHQQKTAARRFRTPSICPPGRCVPGRCQWPGGTPGSNAHGNDGLHDVLRIWGRRQGMLPTVAPGFFWGVTCTHQPIAKKPLLKVQLELLKLPMHPIRWCPLEQNLGQRRSRPDEITRNGNLTKYQKTCNFSHKAP